MSSASSASPGGWASDELFVLRDVSIPPGTQCLRTLATRRIHQQTLKHFLTFVPKRRLPILEDTQMDTAHTFFNNAQFMFGVQHYRGNTDGCSHAQISPILKTREWQATKIPPVSARLEITHSWSHTKKFVSCSCGYQSQQHWVWPTAHWRAFLLVMLCSDARPSETSSVANTDSWCHQPLPSRIRVSSSLRTRRWTMHENLSHGCLHPLDWKWCHWKENVVSILHTEDKEARVLPFSYHQFWTEFMKACQSVNPHIITLSIKLQHRSSNERQAPQRKLISRGQWRTGPERPALREKAFVWLPMIWRCFVEHES